MFNAQGLESRDAKRCLRQAGSDLRAPFEAG